MHVPDEIWHYVFCQFEYPMPLEGWHKYGEQITIQGRAELLALCLVSHQFRRIAQPLLHRYILIENGNMKRDHHTFALLLRSLNNNPAFTRQTHALSIRDNTDLEWIGVELGNITTNRIRAALRHLDLPPALKNRLKRGLIRHGATALLLAHMPHVELVDCTIEEPNSPTPWMLSSTLGLEDELDVVHEYRAAVECRNYFPYKESFMFFEAQDAEGTNQQPLPSTVKDTYANYGLPNLREVRIRAGNEDDTIIPAWTIEPVLLNPNIKTLRALGIDWYGQQDNLKWPNHQSNLENLELRETIVDSDSFKIIMTRCPKLKDLSVDLASLSRQADDPFYNLEIDLARFGDVLRDHGGDLEELCFSTFHHIEDDEQDVLGSLGSLRELIKLRHLKVDHEVLLGKFDTPQNIWRFRDVLPASLETLYLYNGRRSPYSYPGLEIPSDSNNLAVKAFLHEAKLCTPNLQKVVVEWYEYEDEDEGVGEEQWSRETIADGWDVKFVEEEFEYELWFPGFTMTHVVFSKKETDHG